MSVNKIDLFRSLVCLLKSPFSRSSDHLLRRLLYQVCFSAGDLRAERIFDFFKQGKLRKKSNEPINSFDRHALKVILWD